MTKIADIWSKQSVRNIGKLFSANIIAQAVGLLIYPLLTRLYTPEDFGLLNLFTSIGGILVLLSTLEWYNAIVLPKEEQDAQAVVHLSFAGMGILTLLLLLSVPFSTSIASLFNEPKFATFYWLMPIYVLLMGGWNVLNYWYIRKKMYDRISGYQISQSLFSAGYKAGFAFMPKTGGLIYASILSPLCSILLSLWMTGRKQLRPLLKVDRDACRRVAVQYANFPKYSTPRALLNQIVGQLPVLVLVPLFGTRLVGFWGMALMLSFVPISTISRSLYQVFFQKTMEMVHGGRSIAPFYRWFTLCTLAVVVPFFILLWWALPSLTAWLLGAEWETTGEYIRWMLPWLACSLLCASTGYLVDIFFRQKGGLLFEILLAVCRTIGVGVGILMDSFEIAIAGYAISSAVVSAAQYIWYLSIIRAYENRLQ